MNPSQLFLAQRVRSAESQITAALARVTRVSTLAELISASHVVIPAELRSVIRGHPSYRRLKTEVTRRAQHLVNQDLDYLKAMTPDAEQAKDDFLKQLRHAYGAIRANKWRHLQGHEPLVLTQACRQAELLLADRTKA